MGDAASSGLWPAASPAASCAGVILLTVTTPPMLVHGKAVLESDYPVARVVAVVNVLISVGLYGLYRVVSRRAGA